MDATKKKSSILCVHFVIMVISILAIFVKAITISIALLMDHVNITLIMASAGVQYLAETISFIFMLAIAT